MTLTKTNNFTLLEIIICVAILGMAVVTVSFQMRNVVAMHHFQKNIDYLMTDLRKSQLVALADRSDIEMRIYKKGGCFRYRLHSDTPISFFTPSPTKMIGVKEIRKGNKLLKEWTFTIYSNGRIEPSDAISFYQNEEEGFILDLSQSIELKRIEPVI